MPISASFKNSILLITEKIIVIGLAFITSILLARVAGVELFGQYAYVISFTSLFAPLCIMGLNNIVTKYVVKYPKNSHYYVKSALIVRFIGALISIVLGLFFANLLISNNELLTSVALLLCFQSFTFLYTYEYFFLAKNNVVIALTIRIPVLLFTNAIKIYIIITAANLYHLIVIQGLEYLLIGVAFHIHYRLKKHQCLLKKQVNSHIYIALFQKGKWLLMSGVAAVIYLKIDQIMLGYFRDMEEVAYYAAAVKLSEMWYIFPVLVANAYTSTLVQTHKNSVHEFNKICLLLLSLLTGVALIVSVITFFSANWFITLLYGESFSQSSTILSIHIFASIFIFQRAVLSKWLIIKNYLKFSLLTHGVGALVNIALNILLIPEFGGVGAAWATLISYMFASFISLYLTKKTQPFAHLMLKAFSQWPSIAFHYFKNRKQLNDH